MLDAALRAGFAVLFALDDPPIDAGDPVQLVLFPELADLAPLPQIGATA